MTTTQSVSVLAVVLVLAGSGIPASVPLYQGESAGRVFEETVARVIPEKGFQSRIKLGESIVKLVQHGVIDTSKFANLHADRGGLPKELRTVLTSPSDEPLDWGSIDAKALVGSEFSSASGRARI